MQAQHPLAVVTPTLDGDVLTILALVEAPFTTGQLNRLLPDRSHEGIRKVLQRLVAQGVVDAERVGYASNYRLNREHLAAEPIIALANQRRTLLQRIEENIKAWAIHPVYGAVFGSTMRGDMRTNSDVDIFLVRPDDGDTALWEDQTHKLAILVTRWTGNDARVLDMNEAEVRAGANDPVFATIADQRAGTVFGGPDWLRASVRGKARSHADE